MTHDVLFAVAVLAPALVLILLRVDASIAYLALCLGYVMVQFVASEAVTMVSSFYPHASSFSGNTIKIFFLWLPVVLTAIVLFHSVSKRKMLFNILPALCVGLLGVVLVEPLLSASEQNTLTRAPLWHQFQQAQTLIVVTTALISLGYLWLQHRFGHKSGGKREKG